MRKKFFLQNKPLKTQIKITFIVIVICTSIIPITYLSINNLNKNLENEEELSIKLLNGHVRKLAVNFEATLTQFQVSFDAISSNSQIGDIVEYCAINETLINDFEDYENKTAGDFYPQRLESIELYITLIDFFIDNIDHNDNLDMIRIFSDNGNIIAGIVEDSTVGSQYRGDRSWFQDINGTTDLNKTYTSSIRPSLFTHNPTISFSIPILINNEVKGMFLINYNIDTFIPEFKDIHEFDHQSCLIDPNYENAEGDFLGEVYIINTLDNESCFNESNGGNIDFEENMFISLSQDEIGEITINNTEYYFSFYKVTFNQRVWYIVHLTTIEFFSESSIHLLKHDITVLLILVFFNAGVGVVSSIVVSNTIVKNQEELKKAEEEVKHSGKIIRTVFQAIPDEFILFSREGIYLESQGSEISLLINSESLIDKNFKEVMPENVVEIKNNAVEQLYKTKQPQIFEFNLQMPNGKYLFFESRLYYYSEEIYASITRDITEKKEAEGIIIDFNKKLENEIMQRTTDLNKVNIKVQTIFETANEGFWEVDNNNDTIDVNIKLCELLGKKREDLIGKNIFDFLTPEGKETISFHHKEYREYGQKSSYELTLKTSESKFIDCIVNAAPILDDSGKKIGSFGMISDITYLKEAEKKLKKQLEKLDCLYEISRLLATPNILIKDLLQDSLPLILRASHNPEMTFVSISYGVFKFLSENFRETDMKFTILETINEKNLEIDVYIPEENAFSEEEINLIKDIEDRIKNEILRREIDQENLILADMVKNSPDAIFSMNNDAIITSWNRGAEKIYGYTSKEIIGKPFSLLIIPNKIDDINNFDKKIAMGSKIYHYETKGLNKSGKILDISATISFIKSSKGKVIGSFSITRDFTETNEQQKLYQEQILKSSQFKSNFMASMSHELRTPLNSIIGFSEILLEKFYGGLNEQQEGYLNNIKSSGDHLLHLINEILDISKIEAGKVELKIEKIQLYKIINQIEITIRPEYEKKKLKFEVGGLNSKQIIQADKVRFKEILFNLLSNAVKYTRNGIIKLEVIELEDLWKFNVVDTGIGIKEEHFDLIFKEFVRIPSEYTSSVEGTGLGLSLTKRLIELHGGNIGFTSKLDEGTTFTFTLPKKSRSLQ